MTTPIQGTATAGTPASGAQSPLNQLTDPQTFLSLLVAQLKYQSPLDPTSGTQFLSQTAQLNELEQLSSLSTEASSQMTTEQAIEATSMIGKQVSASYGGSTVSGLVSSVQIAQSGSPPTVDVGGTKVPITDVTEVS